MKPDLSFVPQHAITRRTGEQLLGTATQTPQYNRVRALDWCPRCYNSKDMGLLVCWPCHHRLKRSYDGGHGPMERIYPWLDRFLYDHRDAEAKDALKSGST
jgi:hypothetical protein